MEVFNPGKLNTRITIQKKAVATGPFQPLDEYENYKSLWSEVKYLTGRNFYAAKAANVKTDTEFIIRYRNDIDETMRINLGEKHYNIKGIIPTDKRYLTIKAYEIKRDM